MQKEADIPPSCECRISLHGPLEAWKRTADGTWVLVEKETWGAGRATRSVLKRLLAAPGRRLSRGAIQDDLWPEMEDFDLAERTLYNAINQIRRALGKTLVTTFENSYRLADQAVIWVDLDACEGWLREAEDLGGSSLQAMLPLKNALQVLERGEVCDGESGTWVYGLRKQSEEMLRQCRRWLAQGYEAQGKLYQAGEQYRALLSLLPPDEEALQRWMVLLHRSGRRQEALQCYQDIKHVAEGEGFVISVEVQTLAKHLERAIALPQSSDLILPIALLEENKSETNTHEAIKFGLSLAQTLTAIQQWYGMARFCHILQSQIDQRIQHLDAPKSDATQEIDALSRRHFLFTLAALPATFLTTKKQAHKMVLELEELLPQCAASITACWHLSGEKSLDALPPIIDSYLPTLLSIGEHAPHYREVTADLIAQCYFLKAILAWHRESLSRAEIYCVQARRYSDIANNTNLRLTSLNQHALIAYYAKDPHTALQRSEEAHEMLLHASHEHIFPIMQGRVFMYLAAFQAQLARKDAEHTLEQAKEAFACQSAAREAIPLYADCAEAPLKLWDGLTSYHRGMSGQNSIERALHALRVFGRIQPDAVISERFRLECLTNRTLAAIRGNEMEEALVCFKAGKQGAKALESKQRRAEVEYSYQAMLKRWPKEERVQALHIWPECE